MVSLLCYWIFGVVGGRGLLHQYRLLGPALGRFASAVERALCRERKRCLVLECGAEAGVRERERENDEL
jgi:hypothetical protein